MSDVSTLTGASFPIKVSGVEYHFSPLRLIEFGELEQWARAKLLEIAARASMNLPEDVGMRLLDTAFSRSLRITLLADEKSDPDVKKETEQLFNSLDGVAQILLLSLRQKHSGIRLSEVQQLLSSPEFDANAVTTWIMKRSGMGRGKAKDLVEEKLVPKEDGEESSKAG